MSSSASWEILVWDKNNCCGQNVHAPLQTTFHWSLSKDVRIYTFTAHSHWAVLLYATNMAQ